MGNPSNIEQFAPQLLLALIRTRMGDHPIVQREALKSLRASEHYPRYLAKLDTGYGSLAGDGSFNHQQMLQAVRLRRVLGYRLGGSDICAASLASTHLPVVGYHCVDTVLQQ